MFCVGHWALHYLAHHGRRMPPPSAARAWPATAAAAADMPTPALAPALALAPPANFCHDHLEIGRCGGASPLQQFRFLLSLFLNGQLLLPHLHRLFEAF